MWHGNDQVVLRSNIIVDREPGSIVFAIAFQWLLISYCVRLPMILASRGCLLCFNLGFLCLAALLVTFKAHHGVGYGGQ